MALQNSSMPTTSFRIRLFALAFLAAAVSLGGCTKSDDAKQSKPAKQPLLGVKLRIAIADDHALAAAILQMQGEWNHQTGSDFEVIETTSKELAAAKSLPADAVVCPAPLLGVLAERDWLSPVPQELLSNAEWTGLFELPKIREAVWGRQTVAVPFGSPVFCCYYRADLLEKLGRHPPRTWDEYQELAELLAKDGANATAKEKDAGVKKSGPWCGAIEPLAPGWAGLTLLARAAPYLKHRSSYSALFRIDTMEPQIATSPMVEALKDLVAATKLGPADPASCDPASARAAFWRGECGLALTWPTANDGATSKNALKNAAKESHGNAAPIRMGTVELPGTIRVFNINRQKWEKRANDEDTHVPLLSIAGRLGVVSRKAANTTAAFQLLMWLSDGQRSGQVSAASDATTLFRQANLQYPMQWVEKPMSMDAAVHYGAATAAAFQHEAWLGALRIPGRDEYLAALDDAVLAAVRGEQSPAAALEKAEKQWRDITDRLGIDRQRAAYKHSLGLD
jgi:ABC-type glycerol-3-phosphate transport system substrate-binding protein